MCAVADKRQCCRGSGQFFFSFCYNVVYKHILWMELRVFSRLNLETEDLRSLSHCMLD